MEFVSENHLNIRPGKQNEIQVLERWIKDEGWDHSTYDTMSQLKIDSNSLLVAADQDDKPVGFGSAIACMNDLVYVDNFIVRADFRGKGFGRILLKDGIMKRLVNRNGVLDSLPAMADTYKKYGFIYPGVRTVLLTITIDRDIMFKPLSDNINIQVKPLENSHWPGILQFDKTVYPTIDREKILRAFFVGPNVTTLVALEQDKVVGFGSLHKKDEGLFGLRSVQAEDEEIAERIIQMLFQHAGNGSACQLVFPKGKGLPTCMKSARQGEDLIRLYTKPAIVVNTDKIWATTVHIV
ncbi:uncharacterized protein LOC128220424 [Mya arenaria]|uniref:uncharacterized protein LOC128220424 n=1 Tax=Mya arenaria TaxID=6604 RepID=UPI0022E0CD72|nr:uncharacterized protein LOC128220424 [Mya arenaria]